MTVKSYAEHAADMKTAEYAWITTESEQELSDGLDRLMGYGYGIGTKWRDIYPEHGREIACLEFMYERNNIEAEEQRRGEQRRKERHQQGLSVKLDAYLEKREALYKQPNGITFGKLKESDTTFVAEWVSEGHSIDECLDEFGRTAARDIERLQSMELFWYETRQWEAKKKRRAEAEAAEKRRLKDEADQRQAEKFAKAVRTEAERLLKEIIASGVFRGK